MSTVEENPEMVLESRNTTNENSSNNSEDYIFAAYLCIGSVCLGIAIAFPPLLVVGLSLLARTVVVYIGYNLYKLYKKSKASAKK